MGSKSVDVVILRAYLGGDMPIGMEGLGYGAALILGIAILLLISAFVLVFCTSPFIRRTMGLLILECTTILAAWHWLASAGTSPVQILLFIPVAFAVRCFFPKTPLQNHGSETSATKRSF